MTDPILVVTAATLASVSLPPSDPYFDRQISFESPGGVVAMDVASHRPSRREFTTTAGIDLNIREAWAITTGSRDVIVAVIDDGFFYRHEDLEPNIWRNPGETGVDANGHNKATNGVDDDDNGYVDDVMGWDFAFHDPDPDGYVFDGMDAATVACYRHGNPSLGIIGAVGDNGVGVAGINWEVSLMLLKAGAQGTPRHMIDARRTDRTAAAIRYAADNGARIISFSQFVEDFRPARLAALRDAFDYAAERGVLICIAAGNSGLNIDEPSNATYPACFTHENIIVVAEIGFDGALDITDDDRFHSASNYGPRTVDIAALGRNFTTDVRHGRAIYSVGGGTSHATPVVAGVAALCLAVNPDLTVHELKETLLRSARPLPSLAGKIASGGMIDAGAAVRLAMQQD